MLELAGGGLGLDRGPENVLMVPDVRPPGRWEPAELGVHPVTGGGPRGSMPAYIRRPLDELLRLMLDPEVAGGRLIVVRGEACAGKSRAAYEAVADRLADWLLEYPPTAAALAARLEAGIPAGTVLWLGELCRPWTGDLPPQDRNLMPEHQHLRILGGVTARQQHQPAEHPDHEQVQEAHDHKRRH
jgi:hypothetical protein